MKLSEIIKNLDRSEKNSSYVDICELATREFDLNAYIHSESKELTCYYFLNWYCTDTYVGGRVYFLNDEPVATSWQNGRKMSEEIYWVSKEAYNKVRDHILTLINEVDKTINIVDLEEEWGIGYEISFGSQLLTKKVYHK